MIYNISATNKSKYSLGCSILENVVIMSPLPSLIIKANNYLVLTLIYLTIASYCFFLYWVLLVMEWKLLVPSYLIQLKPLVNSSPLFIFSSLWEFT